MKSIGTILIGLGLAWLAFALNYHEAMREIRGPFRSGPDPMTEYENKRTNTYLSIGTIAVGVVLLGVGTLQRPSGNDPGYRTCPKCAEAVRVAAVVCKHCGSDLQPVAPNQSKSSYRALAKAAEDAERRQRRT